MNSKKNLLVTLIFGCISACTSLAFAQDQNAPWVSLFNGKDLTGWTLKGGGGKAFVQDGEMVCHVTANTKEHTFVCTNDSFTDFILEMDMKIDGDFNTGIVLRGVDSLPAAPVRIWGYMIKVDPTPRKWTGGIFEDFGMVWQWLSTLADNAPAREAFKINEWNRFRVEVLGSHIKVWINGVPTANLIDTRYTKGCIALKIHWTGNFPEREKILAHFKDIRIITDNPDRFAHPIDIPVVQTVDESGINVPAGFRALLVTGGSKKPDDRMQYLAVTPSGSIYARTSRGIIALQRRSGDSHADAIEEFGSGGGTGIAVHDGSLYYSTDSTISRYQLTQGKLVPQGEPQVIVKGLPPEEGAVHPFAFDGEGRLLVEAGAVENAINPSAPPPQDLLQNYGGFWRFDANKPDQNFTDGFHYAKGVLHAPSVAWNPTAKTFFTITQGRERLDFAGVDAYDALDSAERPANELHRLDEGVDLGWPLTYYDAFKHARMVAPNSAAITTRRLMPENVPIR